MMWTPGAQGREDPAVGRAKHILDLLQAEKFDEVTKDAWTGLQRQAGAFGSVVDARLSDPVSAAAGWRLAQRA